MEFLKSKISSLEEQNKNIKITTEEKIINSLETNVKKYAEVVSNGLGNAYPPGQNTEIKELKNDFCDLKQTVKTSIEEEKEDKRRQRKQLNVCIFNIPEPTENSTHSPEDQDVMKLKAVFENKVAITQNELVEIYRIGMKTVNQKNPRPVIMKFNNKEKRNQVLSLRKLGYESNDSNFTKVFIAPDRTKKQLEDYKKQQKRKLEEESNGKSLNTKNELPFRNRPQFNWGI